MPNSDASATSLPARYPNGRFGPGNPGRHAGARGRMSHKAVIRILEDFDLHSPVLLDRMRKTFTPAYFEILCRLLEKTPPDEPPAVAEFSDAEAARLLGLVRTCLQVVENPRTALVELDAMLLAGPEPHRPSRRGCYQPRPSQTRTCRFPASGSSCASFAQGEAY